MASGRFDKRAPCPTLQIEPCMSDAPQDRKEAVDAPERPRNPWVSWLVWLVLAPMLYVLSIGPVCWLVENRYIPPQATNVYPVQYLPESLFDLLRLYLALWVEPAT